MARHGAILTGCGQRDRQECREIKLVRRSSPPHAATMATNAMLREIALGAVSDVSRRLADGDQGTAASSTTASIEPCSRRWDSSSGQRSREQPWR